MKNDFLHYLKTHKSSDHFILRKAIQVWQTNFDANAEDLVTALDDSLQTKVSGRLWEGSKYSYKSGLLLLAENHSDLCQFTLKDLFNEDMSFDMRLNRYVFHCDQILSEIQKDKKKVNHHHQDYYFASLLACLQYPNKYMPLTYNKLNKLFHYLEVLNAPAEQDIDRILKIVRNLSKVIFNDTEFMQNYMSLLPEDAFLGPSLSIVHELSETVVSE